MFKNHGETEKQRIRRKKKEAKEIARWEKEKSKPKSKWYLFYFVLIVTVVYIVDEITTQMGTQMQDAITSVLADMLGGAEKAVSTLNLIGTITIISSALAFLYKPLSDRYGRKIFLVINTFGMGLGLLIVGLTFNVKVYILGALFINFFTPHDMQVIYIQECCPKEKRGTYYTAIKSIATLGMLLIPLLRKIFIPDGYSGWRFVYFIPAAIALIVSTLALLLMRETDPFIDNRLTYLRMTDEERDNARGQRKASAQTGGAVQGFKYMFSHKGILWLGLADIFAWMGMGITQNYNIIMKYGFAGISSPSQVTLLGDTLQSALNATAASINMSLFLFPIGSAVAQLIPGIIADKFGRRVSAIYSSVFSLLTFLIFWYGANHSMNPYFVGLFAGFAVGAFWLVGDMIHFICSEMVPTSVRVSVINSFGLCLYPGMAIGTLLPTAVGLIVGSDIHLALSTVIVSVLGLSCSSILLMAKVKETKSVDLSKITGDE